MAKHAVLKNVLHNGKTYRGKGEIDLTPEEAKPLIASGHVADPNAKSAKGADAAK